MASGGDFRIGGFVLTEEEVRRRKAYLGLDNEAERLLREIHPHLYRETERMVERFYKYLLSHEHTRVMLSEPGVIERLKKLQSQYFMQLTEGPYDLAYFENRLRVGLVHQRIGLSPEWYLGAYQQYLSIAHEVLAQAFGDDPSYLLRATGAFRKAVFLDMSLAIDAYTLSSNERLASEAAALAQANQELRELGITKRRLTDTIVHDLQNPLSGIVAFLEVLEAKTEGLSTSERGALQEALARCDDLSQLIMNVLQLSRAEEGKLELYHENVDLVGIARAAAEAFSLVAERGGRQVVTMAADKPLVVRTDQSLLRRVLYNLIRNALRHTPRGTQVEIDLRAGPPATILIRDNGPGISPELQSQISEPLTGAMGWGGSPELGLGLSFCRMAADALGISFRAEKGDGRGAVFVLELD
jgi:signal transduction histidine kinase